MECQQQLPDINVVVVGVMTKNIISDFIFLI